MRVSYSQPDAAGALGHRRLLRAASARAAQAPRRRGRQARAHSAGPRHRPRALPRRQQPRCAWLDRRRAAPPARCRRPPRLRAPSPRRRADDRPPRRPWLPRRDGARGRCRRPPPRPRRARQADPAALGEPAAGVPPRRRGARPRDGARRPLPPRRGSRARGRLRAADLADSASGLAGPCPRRCEATRARRSSARSGT